MWCVEQKGLDSKERSIDLVSFWRRCIKPHGVMSCFILYRYYDILVSIAYWRRFYHLFFLSVFFFSLFFFFFANLSRILHPSHVFFIYFNAYFVSKKKKKIMNEPWSSMYLIPSMYCVGPLRHIHSRSSPLWARGMHPTYENKVYRCYFTDTQRN